MADQTLNQSVFKPESLTTKTSFILFPKPSSIGADHSYYPYKQHAHSRLIAVNDLGFVSYDFIKKRPTYLKFDSNMEYDFSSIPSMTTSTYLYPHQVSILWNPYTLKFYVICPTTDGKNINLHIISRDFIVESTMILNGMSGFPVCSYLTKNNRVLVLTFLSTATLSNSANRVCITCINDDNTVDSSITLIDSTAISDSSNYLFKSAFEEFDGANPFVEINNIVYLMFVGSTGYKIIVYSLYSTDGGTTWTKRGSSDKEPPYTNIEGGAFGSKYIGNGYYLIFRTFKTNWSNPIVTLCFLYNIVSNSFSNGSFIQYSCLPSATEYTNIPPLAIYYDGDVRSYIVPTYPSYDKFQHPIICINSSSLDQTQFYNVFESTIRNIHRTVSIPSKNMFIILNTSFDQTSNVEKHNKIQILNNKKVWLLDVIYFENDRFPIHKTIQIQSESGMDNNFGYGKCFGERVILYGGRFYSIEYDMLCLPDTIDQYIMY